MNVVAFDRRASARLMARDKRVIRPHVIRRVVSLPGASRMSRPEREPTRLGSHSEHSPIEISDRLPTYRWEEMRVVATFIGLFFRLAWLRLTGNGSTARTGRELRLVFERLGGLWMKVGQLMSLRRDVLPPDLCDELTKLQHRAIGFPSATAIALIEKELGGPLHEVFSEFDPAPFAAASLSQVHRARLREGERDVVVKVLRPGIREKFERDMRILRFVTHRLVRIRKLRQMRLKDALGEFEQIFREESDYRYEISNMRELRRTTRGHKIYIPKVYRKYSTPSVIVMEAIAGVLMADYIRIKESDPERTAHWLKTNNINPKKVGERLLISFMRQLFENNLFHADLHPGNIILLRDSRVALIDLGSVGSLDREFLTLYRGLQRALASKDYGKAADLQLRLCAALPSRNVPELRMELVRCIRIWSSKTKIRDLPFRERSVNTGASEVSGILYRYGAQQTWEFLKIARTLSTLDSSLEHLHHGLDYVAILQKYFKAASSRGIRQALKPATLAQGFGAVMATVDEYHLMMGPLLRSSAFNFEATVSKVSRIFALVMKVVFGGLFFLTIGVVYKFMMKHPDGVGLGIRNTLSDRLVSFFPDFDAVTWGFWLFTCLVLLIATKRIMGELLRPESGRKRA